MIVMPANSTGWFWHVLARETGRIGHLYSPRAQRGPWPWFPYALDNGAFSCWNPANNTFDHAKWKAAEAQWEQLIFWASVAPIKPRWAIVPDIPGNSAKRCCAIRCSCGRSWRQVSLWLSPCRTA